MALLTIPDSEAQKQEWREHPDKHAQYSRDVEGELNKRFTLVRIDEMTTLAENLLKVVVRCT